MENIGFHALAGHRIPAQETGRIFRLFHGEGYRLFFSASLEKTLDPESRSLASGIFHDSAGAAGIEVFFSLGGDGTLLDSLLYTLKNQIPLLGINFGRLGFLPCAGHSDLNILLSVMKQPDLPLQTRSVLEISCPSLPELFADFPYALNEVAFIKKDSSSMIRIRTELDGVFLNDYWGDGLIVASPTGSTGYSLSCGGPIIWPDVSSLVITPVSPHNLSMRPVVVSDRLSIVLIPDSRSSRVMLTLDSRSKSLPVNQPVTIRKSDEKAVFIRLPGSGFPETLREKLFWGKDFRN